MFSGDAQKMSQITCWYIHYDRASQNSFCAAFGGRGRGEVERGTPHTPAGATAPAPCSQELLRSPVHYGETLRHEQQEANQVVDTLIGTSLGGIYADKIPG